MKKSIYLANAYGFSKQQRETLNPTFIAALEGMGLAVVEPFVKNNLHLYDPKTTFDPYEVGQTDVREVRACDAMFANINGSEADAGVAVEVGLAIAWDKPIFLFRDDFRCNTDHADYPMNLMLFAGLPRDNWRDFYYTDVEELTDPNKALWKWARGA